VIDNTCTIVGNLVADPEYALTSKGTSRASLRVASTPRYFDRGVSEWRDGESLFVTVTCWRQLAENVHDSLFKGDRVMVTGRLRQHGYERDGQRRIAYEVEADAVGAELSWHRAAVRRVYRGSAPAGNGSADIPQPQAADNGWGHRDDPAGESSSSEDGAEDAPQAQPYPVGVGEAPF
jgi:single-strand DNA-binding protein